MQAVVLSDIIRLRLAFVNAVLRTDRAAFSAANALIGYAVAFERRIFVSDSVCFTEYRIYAEVEILYGSVLYLKTDADITLFIGIKICKIRLFGEYCVNTVLLTFLRNGISLCGKTDHLLEFCVNEYLNTSVG